MRWPRSTKRRRSAADVRRSELQERSAFPLRIIRARGLVHAGQAVGVLGMTVYQTACSPKALYRKQILVVDAAEDVACVNCRRKLGL